MKMRIGALVTLCLLACATLAGSARAAALREGDSFKVRLGAGVKGAATGDTIPVTVPEAFQVDPKSPPELAAGLAGTLTLKMGENAADGQKFDVTQFVFHSKGKKVVVQAHLADATQGVIKSQSASIIKKLLLPPLLGFFIWHGSTTPDAGADLALEVTKTAKW